MAKNLVYDIHEKPRLASLFFTSTAILVYNAYFIAVGGMANEAVAIVSSVIGIIRFKKASNA